MADRARADMAESERLARRWFETVRRGSYQGLVELAHEEIVLVSRLRPGLVVEGRDAFARFVRDVLAPSLYEAVTDRYRPLDDRRVIVEGRIRWIDEERVIRDDPAIWALEFRDGLLLRFLPARSVIEAENVLTARR